MEYLLDLIPTSEFVVPDMPCLSDSAILCGLEMVPRLMVDEATEVYSDSSELSSAYPSAAVWVKYVA